MGRRKKIALLLMCLPALAAAQHVRYKMIHMLSPAVGQYMLHILPWGYDSSITAAAIARCEDSLPGHLFAAKMYNWVFKDDSTKLAVKANEGVYFFHKRFTIFLYWKNGNKKSICYVNRKYEIYHEFDYHDNDAPSQFGRYRKGKKKGRWVYFDTQGKKVKSEKYSRTGALKRSKTFNPPKKTLRTIFNPRHLGGTPYRIG